MPRLRLVIISLLALTTLTGCFSIVGEAFLAGLMAAVALPSFVGAQDKARDAAVHASGNTLRLALEEYATEHDGKYPRSRDWLATLTKDKAGYLPGNKLMRSPWAPPGVTQANALGVDALPGKLRPATASGGPTPEHTVLGVGHPPTSATFDALTYGAIVYDCDPKGEKYVIYCIGKHGNNAEITAVLKSFDEP